MKKRLTLKQKAKRINAISKTAQRKYPKSLVKQAQYVARKGKRYL